MTIHGCVKNIMLSTYTPCNAYRRSTDITLPIFPTPLDQVEWYCSLLTPGIQLQYSLNRELYGPHSLPEHWADKYLLPVVGITLY
jgi:hypothetical protein